MHFNTFCRRVLFCTVAGKTYLAYSRHNLCLQTLVPLHFLLYGPSDQRRGPRLCTPDCPLKGPASEDLAVYSYPNVATQHCLHINFDKAQSCIKCHWSLLATNNRLHSVWDSVVNAYLLAPLANTRFLAGQGCVKAAYCHEHLEQTVTSSGAVHCCGIAVHTNCCLFAVQIVCCWTVHVPKGPPDNVLCCNLPLYPPPLFLYLHYEPLFAAASCEPGSLSRDCAGVMALFQVLCLLW